jgi:hypothetical protein
MAFKFEEWPTARRRQFENYFLSKLEVIQEKSSLEKRSKAEAVLDGKQKTCFDRTNVEMSIWCVAKYPHQRTSRFSKHFHSNTDGPFVHSALFFHFSNTHWNTWLKYSICREQFTSTESSSSSSQLSSQHSSFCEEQLRFWPPFNSQC